MATRKENEQGGGHSEDGGRIGGPFDDGNDSFGDAAEEAEVNRIAALTSAAMEELDLDDLTLKMLIAVGRITGCTIKSNLKKKLALAILTDHQESAELAATEAIMRHAVIQQQIIAVCEANPDVQELDS